MSDAFWTALFACVAACLASLLSWRNGRQITGVQTTVNGQREAMMATITALQTAVARLEKADAVLRERAAGQGVDLPPATPRLADLPPSPPPPPRLPGA
jgi:hypothetical protein